MRTYISAALSVAFLVLLAVLVPLSALSAWVDLEIDDTDRYVAAVAPLASDPDVQNTVADLITDEAMKQIDVGPLQDTVRDFLHQAVQSFTTTDAFQAAWNAANRTAHEAVTAALDGDSGESVTIDLAPVTEKVKQNLVDNGVPFADQIPVQHTDIQIISADRADQMRQSFRWLRAASVWPHDRHAGVRAAGRRPGLGARWPRPTGLRPGRARRHRSRRGRPSPSAPWCCAGHSHWPATGCWPRCPAATPTERRRCTTR